MTAVSIVVIYFFYPETKKKSLEELAAYFGETVINDPVAALEKSDDRDGGMPYEKDGKPTQHAEKMS